MTSSVDYSKFCVYHNEELVKDTFHSTEKVQWFPGTLGEKIWMGKLVISEGGASGVQHHGDADTVHYILEGTVTIDYNGQQVVLEKGDFFYAPPFAPYAIANDLVPTATVITTMAPQFNIYTTKPAQPLTGEYLVVRAAELTGSTDQTDNLPRKTAVQAPRLWIGRVSGAPAKNSGTHHHGEAETAGFIVSGETRILHGDEYAQYGDLTPGDFLRVPPFLPHIESNLSESVPVEFLTARNPLNIVVNLK